MPSGGASLALTDNNHLRIHPRPKYRLKAHYYFRKAAIQSYLQKQRVRAQLVVAVKEIYQNKMAQFQDIAQQFTEFYYKTFDENRQNLAALYKEHSMLTFENSPVQGAAAITEKLVSLPFAKVQHEVTSLDAQPSNEAGGILVLVSGRLLVDEEQRPMSYTQAFQLLPDGAGSYFVFNDVFRLIYAAA